MKFGISGVDRELGSGLESPQLLTFEVDPNSEYQKVIYNMLDNETEKNIFIISTQYSKPVIESKLEQSNIIDKSDIIVIDMESEKLNISKIKDRLEKIPEESVVYIESIQNICEQISESPQTILNTVYEFVSQRSLFILTWVQRNTKIANKILHNSDTNIQVRIENELSYEVAQYLVFTKLLNKQEITQQFKLELRESTVDVDTSRNVS